MASELLMKTLLLASVCSMTWAVYAQTQSSGVAMMAAEAPDAVFVQDAAHGGLAEVALSKQALDSASSPAVRSFAQKMVHDHTKNNKQLAMIAAHENIAVPHDLDSEHAQLRDQLAALHGADFDHAYIRAMLEDHQKMVDLLKSSESTVSTEELRTFIKQTLPIVQDHLRMAGDMKAE